MTTAAAYCIFLKFIYILQMEKSETSPTIFSLRVLIFQRSVRRFRAALAHSGIVYRAALRGRGTLTRGKALALSCHFFNATQLKTILRTGMSYLTLQVYAGIILQRDFNDVMPVDSQVSKTVKDREGKVRGQIERVTCPNNVTGHGSKWAKQIILQK